jgi:hypothetical protein
MLSDAAVGFVSTVIHQLESLPCIRLLPAIPANGLTAAQARCLVSHNRDAH